MTIKNKITASSIVLFAFSIILIGVNWLGNNSVANIANNAYLFKDSVMHLQGIFRGINEFIIDEGEPLSIELIEEHLTGFENSFTTLKKEVEDPDLSIKVLDKMEPQWIIVRDGSRSFVKNNPWISLDDDKAMLEYGKLTTEARKLYKIVYSLSEESKELSYQSSVRVKNIVNTSAILIFVIISLFLLSLFRIISTPITELQSIAKSFSRGDFSRSIDASHKDEFGKVASDFNIANEKIKDMLSNIKDVANILASNSEKISSSAMQIAGNAKEQSSQTEKAVMALEDMNASFFSVAEDTSEAAKSAQDATELSLQSADVITGTVKGMQKIAESVHESASSIEALDAGSKQISEIIKVINDIAEQTNLLALNAAIEAARAGEHGRGFAVVADEVRKLAEKTTSSTKEIGTMVKNIQDNTSQTVDSLQGWRKDVEDSFALANQAGNALQMIVATVNNITGTSQRIAASAEEQSRTSKIIISDVEEIATLAKETAENAQNSSNSTVELNVLVQQLQHILEGFILSHENNSEKLSELRVSSQIDHSASST